MNPRLTADALEQTDATVDALRGMVHETTGGVLTKDNITLKHKSRTMEPTDAQLGSFGVRDGSDIVLILNNDGQGVPAAPTMVNTQFPGEPVAKKPRKAVEKAKGPNGAASVMGSGGGAAMSTEATVVPPAAASVRSQVARPDKEAPAPQTDVARGGEEEATGTALRVPAPRTGEEANLQLQLMLLQLKL